MNYIQVNFKNINQNTSDILVALLSPYNYDIFEEGENALLAAVQEEFWDEAILKEICTTMNVEYSFEKVAQKNWNAEWESAYEPIIVNEKVGIRAHFHAPLINVAKEIIITPKMSFGTGHHATTRLVMKQMSQLNFQNKTVLDYGCGTGVLAIYAQYLGAKKVVAIDIDEWCVENTLENIQLNNSENISTYRGDLNILENQKFDIILANINLHILEKNMANFYNLLGDTGTVIMSGILDSDIEKLLNCAKSHGFLSTYTESELNWSILHIEKIVT